MRLEKVESSPEVRVRWAELARDSGSVFATPEWSEAWWACLGEDEIPELFAGYDADDGRIVSVASMARGRVGPTEVLRFAGHGPADVLGPACSRDRLGDAMRALTADELDAPILLAERLPVDPTGVPGFITFEQEASPVVDLDGDWEGYLAGRSSNFRSQVRRKERKLVRENGLRFRLADEATLEGDLETLFALHDRRWAEAGSGAFAGARGAFHRDFAAVALARGWLRLWVAEVDDGHAVAAWYGFRYGGHEWYYQAGRDPDWERSSVGLVLLAHTMRAAAEDGIGRYRLLRGDDSYKDRFATGDEPVTTAAAARTRSGYAALRLARRAGSTDLTRRGLRRIMRQRVFRGSTGASELAALLDGA